MDIKVSYEKLRREISNRYSISLTLHHELKNVSIYKGKAKLPTKIFTLL